MNKQGLKQTLCYSMYSNAEIEGDCPMETVQEGVAPMAVVSYEFRTVRRLESEAIGVPGKRTFRLLADNDAGSAIIWTAGRW